MSPITPITPQAMIDLQRLQQEMPRAVQSFRLPKGQHIYFYLLARKSIDILVYPHGASLHVKQRTRGGDSEGADYIVVGPQVSPLSLRSPLTRMALLD